MSKQLECAALLRKAADALISQKDEDDTCSSVSNSSSSTRTSNTTSTSVSSAIRSIFAPYSSRPHTTSAASRGRHSGRRQRPTAEPVSFWSHRFCLLASSTQVNIKIQEMIFLSPF